LSTTEVFKDNAANVKNSIRMGHDIVAEHRLFLSEKCGVLRYDKAGTSGISNTDRVLLSFGMTRDGFTRKHPVIAEYYKDRTEMRMLRVF
jgi:hypothetical protein